MLYPFLIIELFTILYEAIEEEECPLLCTILSTYDVYDETSVNNEQVSLQNDDKCTLR